MSEIYTSLAAFYDKFMSDVPYGEWADYIQKTLEKYGIKEGLVCDLGCGSGTVTTMLSDRGFDMTGIDASAEMLDQAMEKRGDRNILYLQQDIREFELYGTMRAIISVCDTLNYITDKRELKTVFRTAANYLDPGGVFLFDLHTPYYYEKILGARTFAEADEDCAYIWENRYERRKQINEYCINLFVRSGDRDPIYIKQTEIHIERAYSREWIEKELKSAGLELLSVTGGYSDRRPTGKSERLVYAARLPVNTQKRTG